MDKSLILDEPTVRIEVPTLVLTGRTTTIDCNVSSTEPITELTWLKDGYKIQLESDSNKYAGGSIHTPSLTIHSCDDQDKASYRCKARNIAGTGQSAVVQLDVAGNSTNIYNCNLSVICIPMLMISINSGRLLFME